MSFRNLSMVLARDLARQVLSVKVSAPAEFI